MIVVGLPSHGGAVISGGVRGVRARASEGGGAAAREWERGWECDCEVCAFCDNLSLE